MSARARLSQCMIVKNEERNIERALSWGRGLVCEQIVVDTGSTDRTVEIAERMGARVVHFDWNDDFSAAKNFAIEQAAGDWIALLDADEYFTPDDAARLMGYLDEFEKDRDNSPFIIQCAWLQVADDGKARMTALQDRVFRNLPALRYRNRVHEVLTYTGTGVCRTADLSAQLSIFHTGYMTENIEGGDKTARNLRLLKKEVADHPDNYEAWAYLGREYLQAGLLPEARDACRLVIAHPEAPMISHVRTTAFCSLMEVIAEENRPEGFEELSKTYQLYDRTGGVCPDMEYWTALYLFSQNRNEEGAYWLEKCLDRMDGYHDSYPLKCGQELANIYHMLLRAYRLSGQKEKAVKYAVLSLRVNRWQEEVLTGLLLLLGQEDPSPINAYNIYSFLEKLYDYGELKDKLFLIKTAKKTGFQNLDRLLAALLTEEETQWLSEGARSAWYLTREQCAEKYPEVPCVNETDRAFLSLMEKLRIKTAEELAEDMKNKLYGLKEQDPAAYDRLLQRHAMHADLGSLNPDTEDYSAFEVRSEMLKGHADQLRSLYGRLGDYRSKKTLLAVLNSWLHLDARLIKRAVDNDLSFFDTDLIPSGQGEVLVDAGAYTGDTVIDFFETYGRCWEKIYCYEPTPESAGKLRERLNTLENVEIRERAVGKTGGIRYLERREDPARNRISETGASEVEVVSIDEDIPEPVTFILLDTEGAQREALAGCERHVREGHPRLAISLSHDCDDLWVFPEMIAAMDSSYRFYLRCYEEKAGFPEKLVLYAF